VPYALHELVDLELRRLEELGVIEPVESLEWAAHIIPAVKADGIISIVHCM
jgi:hypothetical protein